jgi:dihydrofolate reductase
MTISIIVATDSNNLIGNNNQLPWHLPADLKHFKNITTGHTIIMGRKTYDSIGKALPNRKNIVITRNTNYTLPDAEVVNSLQEALQNRVGEGEVFIIGGSQIFNEALPLTNKLYLTIIHHTFHGDTWLPKLDLSKWKLLKKEFFQPDEKNIYSYSFIEMESIS